MNAPGELRWTGNGVRSSAARSVIPTFGWNVQLAAGAILAVAHLLALGAGLDAAVTLVIALGAAISVVWPAAGLAMIVVIMPMREPEILVPIRINAILAGAIILGCTLRLPRDRIRIRLHPGVALLLGYVVLSALSIPPIISGHPAEWTPSVLNVFLRLMTGVSLFLAASYLFQLMPPRPIVALAMVGATLAALLAIGDIANALPVEAWTRGLVVTVGGSRASGAFSDPNFLGTYMATALVLGLGMLGLASRRAKVPLIGVVIVMLACVALTYSRTAYLSAVIGVAVLIGLQHRWAGLLIVIVGAVIGATLYPAFLDARQGGALTPSDLYYLSLGEGTRATIAVAAVAMFASFPVFGVGFGAFQFVSPSFVTSGAPDSTFSHNQYLNVLAEQGIVGVLFLAAMVSILTVALLRSTSPLRATALAMGSAYLVGSLFLHTATVFQSSSLLWLILAAALVPGPARTIHHPEV